MAHKPDDEFETPPLAVGVYEHYKSPDLRYAVLGVGFDTETQEPMVIYKPLYKSNVKYWIRPYKMFISEVMIDGISRPRFRKVDTL